MIDGIDADALFADRAYDTDEIICYALTSEMEVVIPSKRNRKKPRQHDEFLYKFRHLVENAFYAKSTASFLAAVQIRCMDMWLKILA